MDQAFGHVEVNEAVGVSITVDLTVGQMNRCTVQKFTSLLEVMVRFMNLPVQFPNESLQLFACNVLHRFIRIR